MRRFHLAWVLVLACQGSIMFNGRPVQLVAFDPPPPPPAQQEPPPPAPPPPRPPPYARTPPHVTAEREPQREAEEADTPRARETPVRPAPAGPWFQRKPMPSDEDLYRFGMACRAGKRAACRELALIFLHDEPDTSCGSWATDDPNGPVATSPGHEDKPACKPPEYRHLGPCGDCEMPRISCGYSEQPGKSVGGGSPFGHPSSKCPRGEWCSSFGVCIAKSAFPVEHKHLPRGETCYLDRECASGQCPTNGTSTFGSVGNCR